MRVHSLRTCGRNRKAHDASPATPAGFSERFASACHRPLYQTGAPDDFTIFFDEGGPSAQLSRPDIYLTPYNDSIIQLNILRNRRDI